MEAGCFDRKTGLSVLLNGSISLLRDEGFLPYYWKLEGRQRISPKIEKDGFNMVTMSQIDLDLGRMRTMTAEQAAEAAARAVAEAEVAIAVAEEVTREAETAEDNAEVAQAFVKAARKTLIGRTTPKMTIQS